MEQELTKDQQVTGKKRSGRLVTIIALLLALLAAIASGLVYWHASILFRGMTEQLKDLHAQVSEDHRILFATQQQLQDQQIVLTNLRQVNFSDQTNWVVAEVRYLVQLANYNLAFTKSVPVAIELLKNADHKLALLNSPALLDVRTHIAQDISQLQALPLLDRAGILTRLNALQQQATQLHLPLPKIVAEQTQENPPLDKTGTRWHRALQSSLAALQKMVIIRRTDKPVTPLLPEQEQAYLQQNLQLLLQQAQWAVLQEQPAIYQQSLQQAKNWVGQYFSTSDPATQAVLQSLTELLAVNLEPPVPDLSDTIAAIAKVQVKA